MKKRKKLSRFKYRAYINSPGWEAIKQRYRQSKLQKTCFCCGIEDVPLDLHHKSYKTLGHENLNHLCMVCRPCHTQIHDLKKSQGLSLWRATKKVRSMQRRKQKRALLKTTKLVKS